MTNILILGCGKIGSRHVQSLSKAKFNLNIFILDPSNDSISVTKNIFYTNVDHPSKVKLIIITNLSEIKVSIKYLIIASNSKERSTLLKNSLNFLNPTKIILEKFLFTKTSDYNKFEKILIDSGSKVWVNEYMGYEFDFISKYFKSKKKINVKVVGNWGLCCNTVHFIEIFHHLISRRQIKMKHCEFNDELINSKRAQYYELYGTMELISENYDSLIMICSPEFNESIIDILVTAGNLKLVCKWDLKNENIRYNFYENECLIDSSDYPTRRQSERTLELIEDLEEKNECKLPKYRIAKNHHLLVINEFKKKFIELGLDINDEVPIT